MEHPDSKGRPIVQGHGGEGGGPLGADRQASAILWGADAVCRPLIRRVQASQAVAWPAGLPNVFEPQSEPLREFRALLAEQHEAARARGAVAQPHVVMVAAAFAGETDSTLTLLAQANTLLRATLPNDSPMTLVALLPPMTAEDGDRIAAFRFFHRLEGLVTTLAHLRSVCVLQLRHGISEATTPEDQSFREFCELLVRAVFEPQAARLTAEVNPLAVGDVRSISTCKCCYSTAGCIRLIHPADACLQHLRARFHRDVFHSAFMDERSIGDEERAAIQAVVDSITRTLLDVAKKRLPGKEKVAAEVLAAALDPTPVQPAVLAFNREFDAAVDNDLSRLDDVLASMENETSRDLRQFIPTSPGYLAGVQCYLAALRGKRLAPGLSTEPDEPSGVPYFREHLCVRPFITLVVEALEPQLERIAKRVGTSLPKRETAELRYAWLERAATSVDAAFRQWEPGEGSPARFFAASFRCVRNHHASDVGHAGKARELLDNLVIEFANEATALHELANKIRDFRKKTEGDLYTLCARYSWLRRVLFPPEWFRIERARLRGEIHRCDVEVADLRTVLRITHEQFLELINAAVLPYVLRTRISQRFENAVDKAWEHFSAFVNGLADPVSRDWEQETIPQVHSSIAETVVTPEKVETLYQRTLGGLKMPDFAAAILRFSTERRLGPDGKPASYAECTTFTDHYFAGPHTLLDRMRDYSTHLFGPVRLLGALDILEIHGKDAGRADLADAVRRARQFLAFASPVLAQVENEGVLQVHFFVRTGGGEHSRLGDEYGRLFLPHMQFLDSRDPNVIDITCLLFGIPAFLIYTLQEGRKLAEQSEKRGRTSGRCLEERTTLPRKMKECDDRTPKISRDP